MTALNKYNPTKAPNPSQVLAAYDKPGSLASYSSEMMIPTAATNPYGQANSLQ